MIHLIALLALSIMSANNPTTVKALQKESIYESNSLYEKHDGKQMNFRDKKGEVILVYVWASWCAASDVNSDKANSIAKNITDTNFEVVTVTTDRDRDEWRGYIKRHRMVGTHLWNRNDLQNPLSQIVYVPEEKNGETKYWIAPQSFFLIDKEGFGKILTDESQSSLEGKIRSELKN